MRAHTFDGRLNPASKKSNGLSQASFRRGLLTYDQSGRPYDGVIELRSNAPTGPLHPKYQAPIYPDPKYLVVNPDNTSELYIDFPNWFRDRRANEQEYHARAVRLSQKKGWPAPKRGEYSEMVEAELGPLNSRCSPLIVAAMYQENPWIIGACRGCSTRDLRTREFIPRFSHNCICETGFVPYPPDPRLEHLVVRPEDELPGDDSLEDFSIEAYAALTKQTVDEVAERPSQFRRIKRRAPVDGAENLDSQDTSANSAEAIAAATDALDGPEMSEDDERKLQAAVEELENAPDDADIFAPTPASSAKGFGKGPAEIDADAEQEVVDPGAVGGRRVPVAAQARVERQAPRQGNASTQRQIGAQRSATGAKTATKKRSQKPHRSPRRHPDDNRPSLADGAAPVISD